MSRTGIKHHQSLGVVTCSELLKSYSHHVACTDPHLFWYVVKTANFPAIVAQRRSMSVYISDMKGPSAHNHLKNARDWNQRSRTCVSITKLDAVKLHCLSDWCPSLLQSTGLVLICHVQRNPRGNFLCYYVLIIVILGQIALLRFLKSSNMQTWWLIQVLRLIIGVKVVQIAPFRHRSGNNESKFAKLPIWDVTHQVMTYIQ